MYEDGICVESGTMWIAWEEGFTQRDVRQGIGGVGWQRDTQRGWEM